MSPRIPSRLAALALGLLLATQAGAEIVRVAPQGLNGKVVAPKNAPQRGMSKAAVIKRFGAPLSRTPAVGEPPISSWKYPGYRVYFENDRVIHAVIE